MSKFQRYLLGMFFVILSINILGLWAVQFLSYKHLSKLDKVTTNLESDVAIAIRESSPEKEENLTVKEDDVTSDADKDVVEDRKVIKDTSQDIVELRKEQGVLSALVSQFQAKLSDLGKRISLVESNGATATINTVSAPQVTKPVAQTQPTIKEQTIYIGSGSSSSTNWTDIGSAVIELNSANYPNLDRVIFEANLSIVGGEAYARLKNKTSGQVIEISTVSHNSSLAAQKLSGSFGLTSGSNEYVVQLRSSSNEKVILDGARLRLFY